MSKILLLVLSFVVGLSLTHAANATDIAPNIDADSLYGRSAALLIGVSEYKSPSWHPLRNVPGEIDEISKALARQKFEIVRSINPTGDQLYSELRHFFAKYRQPTDRLLIWFSGHGWTDKSTGLGYIVPIDAPDPFINRMEFDVTALSMTQIVALARDIYAKHALFIFDSCFSGSVFMTRSTETAPIKLFLEDVKRPVRQFITAGDEQQEVPAKSDLVPAFIRGIEGAADISQNGYVSGSQLGAWIKLQLISLGRNTPQFGTILDLQLSRGDFLFFPAAKTPIQVAKLQDSILPKGSSKIIARVNGIDVSEADLAIAETDVGQNLPQGGDDARRDYLVSYVSDMILLAQAAKGRGLQDDADFKREAEFARNKVLMEKLLQREGRKSLTDQALRAVYNDAVKQMGNEEEVHARHILFRVANAADEKASKDAEAKVRAVIARLKKGEDFAKLANELTEDPSGRKDGGDLGYFTQDQMVPEFSAVAFKLDKGQTSGPIKTQFGWHVLKVEDKRKRQPPEFDKVKAQLETYVERKAQVELVNKLRAEAKIERLDKPAQPPAQPQAMK
jgi:peptidyl-prolyl cis-trans isomerase C